MNKKGGFTDIFVFMIVAFIMMICLGIFVYVGATTFTEVRSQIADNEDTFSNQNATQVTEQTLGQVPVGYTVLYWGSVIIIVGMIMSVFIGSWRVTTKPIFFVPYAIISFVAIIVAIPMANSYETLIAEPTLQSSFAHFTGANFLMLYLPFIVAIVSIVGGIIMFASYKLAGQNEQQIFIG